MISESKWFKEGQEARQRGADTEHCPYAARSPKWFIWLEGFNHDQ